MSKILVVDDEPAILELIKETLSAEGYDTVGAVSGEQALEMMEKDPPDLVVLDLMLPGMDGYEVCRQMQRDTRLAHVPVIMLTAKNTTADMVTGYQKGADDYITKPFDTEELLVRVRAQLHHLYHEDVSELTGLPGSQAVEDQINRRSREATEPWAIVYVDLANLRPYNEVYGYVEGDELIRLAGDVLREVVRDTGKPGDFLGHVGGGEFVIISSPDRAQAVTEAARGRFDDAVSTHYSVTDRERGYTTGVDHKGVHRQFGLASLTFDVVENEPTHVA